MGWNMSAANSKTTRSHVYAPERLAGGYGLHAAVQGDEAALRRLVMACLLWEDNAYVDGQSVVEQIKKLVHKLPVQTVAAIAVEAREQQKLRHVPLFLCRELARHASDRAILADTLARVIRRPDEMAEFLALYWKDNTARETDGKRRTLSAQVKKGLRRAFVKFDQYQLSKYDRAGKEISLRDVLFLVHPKPKNQEQAALWKELADKTLSPANTWEVGLSAAKTPQERTAVWTRLLSEGRLPALAFMKNLANMKKDGVPRDMLAAGFASIKPAMLLPIDFLRAAAAAPEWRREIESVLLRCATSFPKLPGWTVFVVDVSGSMTARLSGKSQFTRLDAAAAMTVLAAEMCEHVKIYATAGNDGTQRHATVALSPDRGFALSDAVINAAGLLGGGGIFTRQCLDYIREQEQETPDRIIVFSDSQDCDFPGSGLPRPFGKRNYIVDVSSHKHGVNYDKVWTAEVAGWSEHFLSYIAALEGLQVSLQ